MRVIRLAEAEPHEHTVEDALDLLAKKDIRLPPGTTADNFLERLCVALHALSHAADAGTETPPATPPATGETGVAERGTVAMSLSGRRVPRPSLRPNLPPGVRLAAPVTGPEADQIVRGIDEALGRGKGA